MSTCKFAHSDAELRVVNIDELDASSTEHVPSEVSTQGSVNEQTLASAGASSVREGSEPTELNTEVPRTAPQVVCRLNDAAVAGALTLSGMVFHLTRIFLALYDARPEVADRVGVPADVLATATAEDTWARAGLDGRSLLSFKEFACLCGLPSELMPRNSLSPASPSVPSVAILPPQLRSSKVEYADSDTWSQCSTDDGSSDVSVRSHSGWDTPTSCVSLDDVGVELEVKVVNTFIHVSSPREVCRTKRARSQPCRRSE